MLEIEGVSKRFGGLVALHDVDLRVRDGEIVGLVGPNGAGKTTLLNVISGLYRPDGGTVRFRGEDVTRLGLDRLCRRGIAKTFQHPQSFPGMTAAEAVMVGACFGNHHTPSRDEAREEAEAQPRVRRVSGREGRAAARPPEPDGAQTDPASPERSRAVRNSSSSTS